MAYIARYSPRPGTVAAKLQDNVLSEEKKYRQNRLNTILRTTAWARNQKFIGENVDVLVEAQKIENKNGKIIKFILGKNRHYKTVKLRTNKNIKIGDIVKVKITKAEPFGLMVNWRFKIHYHY